jgi:adenine-specific DNA-methyltransferase
MDFFCGSGTTLVAANELCRHWIGIDKEEKAIEVARRRLDSPAKNLFFESEYSYLEAID